MGSKVSSKMAAPAARVIQVIRPHVPLIKFPDRHGIPKPIIQEASAVSHPHRNAPSFPSVAALPQITKTHVPLTPIPGTPDTLASVHLLPARYRRRPLAVDEMEYIQRGGPE